MGMGFVGNIDATGSTIEQVIKAFIISKEIFGVDALCKEIERLDGKVDAKIQRKMMNIISKLVRRMSRWFLRNRSSALNVESLVKELKPKVDDLSSGLNRLITKDEQKRKTQYLSDFADAKVPKSLAQKVVKFKFKHPFLDIIEASATKGVDLCFAAEIYYKVSGRLSLSLMYRFSYGN